MKKDKLAEILKETNPPDPVLPNAQAQLRRDLLNAPYYRRSHIWQRLLRKEYVISMMITAVFLIVFITPQFFSGKISAMDVLSNLERDYLRSVTSNRIHYLRTLVQTLDLGLPEFIEEKWLYNGGRSFRALVKSVPDKQVIAHTIIRNDSIFNRNTDQLIYDMDITETDSTSGLTDEPSAKIDETMDVRIFQTNQQANGQPIMCILFLTDTFEHEQFSSQTPFDIIDRLKKDSTINYSGEKTLNKISYNVLERHVSHAGYVMFAAHHPELRNMIRKISDTIPSIGGATFRENVFDTYLLTPVQSKEALWVNVDQNQIYKLTHSIIKDTRVISKTTLTFLEDAWLDYDPVVFDPERYGLKSEKQ